MPLLKVAHLADIHIGMENYGRVNPVTGLNQRLLDFEQSLSQALADALAMGVDLVVFAGDIFKTRDPTPTHQRIFARQISRLVQAGVPAFIAAGNHDLPLSTGRATAIELLKELQVPGVTVARTIGLHRVETKSGPAQVLAFPWSVRNQVLQAAEFRNLSISELNEKMIELTRSALRQAAEGLDPSAPTLLVGHAHVLGARIGSERLLTMGADPMYDLQSFDVAGVDYVALGHIHKHQVLAYGDPPIVYAGSIDRVDFGEEGEDKGWVSVEIQEKGRAEWQFHRVNARPFLTVEAKVESDNATEDVIKAIARQGDRLRDAVVRLRISVPPERLGELRDEDLRAHLKEAYLIAPVERQVQTRTRDRWGAGDTAIQHARPLDALAIYLEQQKVEPERRDVLLKYAAMLMGEEHSGMRPEDSGLSRLSGYPPPMS